MTNQNIVWTGFGGDSVRCELWQNGIKIFDIHSGWIPNSGIYSLQDPIPSNWNYGNGYYVKIIDELGNSAESQAFDLGNILVVANDSIANSDIEWRGGDTVVYFELYQQFDKIDQITPPISNTGSIARTLMHVTDSYDRSLNEGIYRLKICDNLDGFGWSTISLFKCPVCGSVFFAENEVIPHVINQHGRFVKRNFIVTDYQTNLQWTSGPFVTWYDGVEWVNQLGDGWRMPNKDEVLLLYDEIVNTEYFEMFDFTSSRVWSSDLHEYLFVFTDAWCFDFTYNYGRHVDANSSHLAIAVRAELTGF